MPICLTSCSSTECDFSEWSVVEASRDRLVEALAFLYLQQEENALRIIENMTPRRRIPKGRVAENVVDKLTAPKPADLDLLISGNEEQRKTAEDRIKTSIWHRDGLLFQHVSWIAARKSIPNGYMTSPHVRQADKGFDGFIIQFDSANKQLERVILCEDKASSSPRSLITKSVWNEIKAIVRGERDDEVLADLATLLKAVPGLSAEGTEDLVDAIFWDQVRQFRVSVATGEDHRRVGGFEYLVNGFETVAPGPLPTRMGGVMAFEDVREGLQLLATEVISKVLLVAGEGRLADV